MPVTYTATGTNIGAEQLCRLNVPSRVKTKSRRAVEGLLGLAASGQAGAFQNRPPFLVCLTSLLVYHTSLLVLPTAVPVLDCSFPHSLRLAQFFVSEPSTQPSEP